MLLSWSLSSDDEELQLCLCKNCASIARISQVVIYILLYFSKFYNLIEGKFRLKESHILESDKCLTFVNHLVELGKAKLLQSCPTLCDPIDGSPPGSPVPGILQARTLEWVASSFSNAWKWKVKMKSLSRVRLFATPWTAASQAPPSMGFVRQQYWSGVPLHKKIHSSVEIY